MFFLATPWLIVSSLARNSHLPTPLEIMLAEVDSDLQGNVCIVRYISLVKAVFSKIVTESKHAVLGRIFQISEQRRRIWNK